MIHGLTTGDAPEIDLNFEVNLQDTLLSLIKKGTVNAAHDLSDGGLITALAEMAISSGRGATVSINTLKKKNTVHEVLFSEAQSGVLVTVTKGKVMELEKACKDASLPCYSVGVVEGKELFVDDLIQIPVTDLSADYESALPNAMDV